MISYDGHGEPDGGSRTSTREPPAREDPDTGASIDASGAIESLRAACHDAFNELHEAGEDLGRLVRIKVGRAQIKTRNLFLRLALLCLGGAALVGVLIASVIFVLLGLAGGVAQLLGAGMWAGLLLVGLVLAILMLGGGSVLLRRFRKQRVAELQRALEPREPAPLDREGDRPRR